MIRVALFNRNLNDRLPSGIKTFLVEVLKRLFDSGEFTFTLVTLDDASTEHLAELFPGGRARIVKLPWKLSVTRLAWLAGVRSLARGVGEHDVYWTGAPWPYGRLDRPLLVTVHDLFPLLPIDRGRGPWKNPIYTWLFRTGVAESCRRAERVVADSQSTLADLGRYFPNHHPSSRVIPLGIDANRWAAEPALDSSELRRKFGIHESGPLFLTLGPNLAHKNQARLVDAFATVVLKALPNSTLVLTGGPGPETAVLRSLVQQHGLDRQILLTGALPFSDVHALVKHASVFVFPSLAEGFGLPALEAFAAGTPVIVSRAGSLPEVVGDAALVVPPHDSQALGREMIRLVEDGPLRERLISRGRARAAAMTWDAAASQYAAVLRELASC